MKVPKDKLHEKLLQATKVIISLVEERDEMKKKEIELKNRIELLEKCLKQIEEANVQNEDYSDGVDPSIITDNETEYSLNNGVSEQDHQNIEQEHQLPSTSSNRVPFHPPSTSHHVPSTSHHVPSTSHHVPSTSHHAPSTSHHGPSTSHHVPSHPHHVPSHPHHVPSTSHHVPSTSHHVPSTSHHVPSTSHHVPSHPHHVPSHPHHGTVPIYSSSWSHVEQDLKPHSTISTLQPLEQIHVPSENLSLSPLRFSDCSSSSGLQALQNAMKLIDEDTPSSLNESTPVKQKPLKGKENKRPKSPLAVEGNRIACNTRSKDRGGSYKVPSLNKQQKPKIRNYNIQD